MSKNDNDNENKDDFVDSEFSPEDLRKQLDQQLNVSLMTNIICLRKLFSNSSDFITKKINIGNHEIMTLYCEGMINLQLLEPLLIDTVYKYDVKDSKPEDLLRWLEDNIMFTTSANILFNYKEIFSSIMSGNVVILIDGIATAISADIAGFQYRAITESMNQVDIRSSREAFTEPIKINLTMIRRRIKSPALKFEKITIGKKSQTIVNLVYLTDVANCKLVKTIKYKLSQIKVDVLLDAGYLTAYLAERKYSILPEIGYAERPDIVCGKISEGRIAILVDGCPNALIIPYLFVECFQTMDDYTNRPVYASFMRILRYLAFFVSILMPGAYVAISSFHPEMFPETLLFNVALSQDITPFPIMLEALIIHIIYELMREAGLRLPRQIGHAVSIVGALVVGESAVSAGIIGEPMVIIVALTSITSFIMSTIYETTCVLKFVFIILGGVAGLYGLTLGLCCLLINMSSVNTFNIPYMSPISPFNVKFMRDVFIRRNWKYLSKKNMKIQNMPGVKKKHL